LRYERSGLFGVAGEICGDAGSIETGEAIMGFGIDDASFAAEEVEPLILEGAWDAFRGR
jgi:hypothetical protein